MTLDRDIPYQSRWHEHWRVARRPVRVVMSDIKKNVDTASDTVTKAPVKSETVTVREFIHGRHTCDACRITPIVGKRFHAINRSDYDLCETCYKNDKGDSFLKFEEEIAGR